MLFFDGACRGNPGPASYGAVIYDHSKEVTTCCNYIGTATNNIAEYSGLYHGLLMCIEHGIDKIDVYGDSLLVINQMLGKWKVKSNNLTPIYQKIQSLLPQFTSISFHHIPRNKNKRADQLANEALDQHEQS